jgi:hypothetical protein
MTQSSEPAERRRLTAPSTDDRNADRRRPAAQRPEEEAVDRIARRRRPHLPITARGVAGFNDYCDRGRRP